MTAAVKKNPVYCRYVKGALDRLLAAVGLLCLCWLYLLVALAVKLDDPHGPVIFRQDRLGKDGRVFRMYKFRTMRAGTEHSGTGVYSDDRDDRVTRVGRVLRATSLDELPQLVNILKGDMALVGFRPPLTYHPWPWEEYTEEQRKMFALRPGVTGWAQVNGRRTVEWNRRIALNVWYTEHVSFRLDVKILLMTVRRVFTNADNANVEATVKK